jgi:hypothetical protein
MIRSTTTKSTGRTGSMQYRMAAIPLSTGITSWPSRESTVAIFSRQNFESSATTIRRFVLVVLTTPQGSGGHTYTLRIDQPFRQ